MQRLQRLGLATETQPGTWAIHAEAGQTLCAMGGRQRELAVFQPDERRHTIIGRLAGKGLADELYDRGYLVVDGTDGKAHYVALPPRTQLEQYPVGAVVEVTVSAGRHHDAQRLCGVVVQLKSHLPADRQPRAIGTTWLDQQLVGGGQNLGALGFGGEARQALQ